MVLEYLFVIYHPNLSALEQSWLHDGQCYVASQVSSLGWENGTSLKDLFPLAQLMLSLSMDTVTEGDR